MPTEVHCANLTQRLLRAPASGRMQLTYQRLASLGLIRRIANVRGSRLSTRGTANAATEQKRGTVRCELR